MYMHYILGECILSHRDVVTASKLDDVALNTYILALDGDVDFKPESVRYNIIRINFSPLWHIEVHQFIHIHMFWKIKQDKKGK